MKLEFLINSCHHLIKANNIEVFHSLIKNNPELMLYPDDNGQAGLELLRIAEILNRTEIIEILIKLRANFADPLKKAIYQGHLQTVELLLNSGKILDDPVWNMEYIFKRKSFGASKEILKLLLEFGQVDIGRFKDRRGQNLLHIICENVRKIDEDAVEIAKILINGGVSVDEVDFFGSTPLLCSISAGNVPLISFLIKKGANVSHRSEKMSLCPLHEAFLRYIICGNTEILCLLLTNGADINSKDRVGRTVLHRALSFKKQELINLFLKKGADVCAVDNDGKTPFFLLKQNFNNFSIDSVDQCRVVMIKEFAKLTFNNRLISKIDKDSIQSESKNREIFQKCLNELHHMAGTKFYGLYSYYTVFELSKNIKKLAILVKNEEFVSKYKICNLDAFPYYKNDFQEIFEEAVSVRDESYEVYSRLNFVFNNFFPDLVVRKLTEYLTLADLPLQLN